MGRKLKGAALRAKKRSIAAAKELVEEKAAEAETQAVVNKADDALFIVDTQGHQHSNTHDIYHPKYNLKKKKTQTKKKIKPQFSNLDEIKVQRLLDFAKKGQKGVKLLQNWAEDGADKMAGKRHRKSTRSKTFDLWKNNDSQDNKKKKETKEKKKNDETPKPTINTIAGITQEHNPITKAKLPNAVSANDSKNKVAIDIAHSGQSYQPDPKAHQTVIQQALAVELRRQEAEEKKRTPISQGLSKETRELLLPSSDEEDSDDDDEHENDEEKKEETTSTLYQKRTEKLTKAMRNKQKRLRAQQVEEEKKRNEKKFLKSLGNLPRIEKDLKSEELEKKQRKEDIQTKKEKSRTVGGSQLFEKLSKLDPIHAPTLPVALPEEIQPNSKKAQNTNDKDKEAKDDSKETTTTTTANNNNSSLRTIKPKGSLLTERMASFVDRSMVCKRKFGETKRVQQQGKKRRKIFGEHKAIQFDLGRKR